MYSEIPKILCNTSLWVISFILSDWMLRINNLIYLGRNACRFSISLNKKLIRIKTFFSKHYFKNTTPLNSPKHLYFVCRQHVFSFLKYEIKTKIFVYLTIGNLCKVHWSQISDDLLHYPESLQHTLFALQAEPLKICSESSSLLLSSLHKPTMKFLGQY